MKQKWKPREFEVIIINRASKTCSIVVSLNNRRILIHLKRYIYDDIGFKFGCLWLWSILACEYYKQ